MTAAPRRAPAGAPALWLALLASLLLAVAIPARAEIRVTDIAGQEVVLAHPAKRIVLGEGRHLAVLGILTDDPVALVAGWRQDKPLDPATLAAYRAAFPALDGIANVGTGNRGMATEAVLALQPDLVVLSLVDRTAPQMAVPLKLLKAAGIPVVFVDFFEQPLENALPSLRLLGQLTGTGDRADAFAAFYTAHLTHIRDTLAAADPPRPNVFLLAHAAPGACCATVGAGIFDDIIEAAGGHNLGRDWVPGAMGTVGRETLLAADVDWLLASGGQHMAPRGGLVLGAGVDGQTARDSFDRLLADPALAALGAVRDGQATGVWHLFNDSPAHIALIEELAKTFHPDLFRDLDPDATMAEMQRRFSPVDLQGTWWIAQQ